MAADGETDRTSVVTYVSPEQKTEWKTHADDLGMSQAEFIRTMVQAGRRDFTLESNTPAEPASNTTDPRGKDLESRVLNALESDTRSWDELVDSLADDFEDRLEACLESLQEQNRIRYSGRDGGYTISK
jgi:hypothetical protein